ncbi:ATP-binding protein [Frankia sp. R82]|uniref:ATP-binding protein n=1 Tax=Frankia sp. R82 TaxID=2950553 RepID=UPI002043E562|nr:ATP-binding protein [Frankia sp. R82]MCM3885045.1 ATP-binding protein [Frankia sp. R82]
MGASESNAGDDFHFWWAASRALALVAPGTRLSLVTLEGLARVDDPDESYETVDVGEYFGGERFATAELVVLSQLKYSTRHPDREWTVARICEKRDRKKQPQNALDSGRSVIADLADAYRKVLADHGVESARKVKIALVTNQPADPLLVASIAAAAEAVRSRGGRRTQLADLRRTLSSAHADVVNKLAAAVKPRLGSTAFCGFVTALDLSQTGTLDRHAFARAVRVGAVELTPGRGSDPALSLFHLVRQEALPHGGRGGLKAADVLAELAAPELVDLYPAPPRLPEIRQMLPVPGAKDLADAVTGHPSTLLIASGPAGAGKTTTLRQLEAHLPAGSVVVLFDCYGAGSYLNAGEERHTLKRFVTQVINELAHRCGTSPIVQAPSGEPELWRLLTRTLTGAAATLAQGGMLVLAVDAADNAEFAAGRRGDRGFVADLATLQLPERVSVVLTARSHRLASLRTDAVSSLELSLFDLPSFDAATSAAHLRQHRPDASDEDVTSFHDRTGGNPRAQYYALDWAEKNGADMATLLDKCARTPEALFADLIKSALQVGQSDAGGRQWLAMLLALARPVRIDLLASALDVDRTAVGRFAEGLAPGVTLSDSAIEFRDDDFETYVRDRVPPADLAAAHARLADLFWATRTSDADAAAQIADHLHTVGRLDDLLHLVLTEQSPAGIADGIRRQAVQGRRLDLAARAAAARGSAAAAVRLAARGCDAASRADVLSRLLERRLDLVARYADIELLQDQVLRQQPPEWFGPVWMRLAAAMSRDKRRRTAARAALDMADGWNRRWNAGRDDETAHWTVGTDDIASAAEARYRLDGLDAAIKDLKRWRPAATALEASAELAARIAGELAPDQVRAALRGNRVPAAAHGPAIASLVEAGKPVDSGWIDEVTNALLTVQPGELASWHLGMLTAAVRFGDRAAAARLARHWAHELSSFQRGFAQAGPDGTAHLRCHAIGAALTGATLSINDLIPAFLQLREDEAVDDARTHRRDEWIKKVAPVLDVALVATRASLGSATPNELTELIDGELASRLDEAGHRWFTHDRSYRAWAMLAAEAALDIGNLDDVLDRLAEAAPKLIRSAAPDFWLDLAELLTKRDAAERAADLCARAADHAREYSHSASNRLDLLARAAGIAAPIAPSLGKTLFEAAVDAATGINDDAARLLAVHADLARKAEAIPEANRTAISARLIGAVEAVAPLVTESSVIPYADVVAAAARLDPAVGLAAASRWDDQHHVQLGFTLPAALVGSVDSGEIPASQALALDHLIDTDGVRLTYQLDIAARMAGEGATGTADARRTLARVARWLRCRVPARDQPALARQFLAAPTADLLDAITRTEFERIAAFESDPNQRGLHASRRWYGDEPSPEAENLLNGADTRTWATLTDDVATLYRVSARSEDLLRFVIRVVQRARPDERADALGAALELPDSVLTSTIAAVATCVEKWRGWPEVRAWVETAMPQLVARCVPHLIWWHDLDELIGHLRRLADDGAIRNAVLQTIPDMRPQLAAQGWQHVAVLLGRLCNAHDATEALLGLLDDHIPATEGRPLVRPCSTEPVPALLWSAFGHPSREMRWRAAHATRDLLTHSAPGAIAHLVTDLVRYLDHADPGQFRDPTLHFYDMSAAVGLLVALHRVATDRPAVLTPHRADFVRHATSSERPHAQIRELARLTALALTDPNDPNFGLLRLANQPTHCSTNRKLQHSGDHLDPSRARRYDFDLMDTVPYWFTPLARVFNVSVDIVADRAEVWIVDRWGQSRSDWWYDVRELRDERSWERMNHRHGSIPPEEKLHLYLEYHAMMAAAGGLVDSRPVHVGPWDEDSDGWARWLAGDLPSPGVWLADLAAAVPVESDLFRDTRPVSDTWDIPTAGDYDQALELDDDDLPGAVLVAGQTDLQFPNGRESVRVWSALVAPTYAEDLQRALAARSEPSDGKLPDEDQSDLEVDHELFRLRGWLIDPRESGTVIDDHDVYAKKISKALPLPGHRFRAATRSTPDSASQTLTTSDGTVIAQSQQWADREPGTRHSRATTSSGYRLRVDRDTLLRYLSDTNTHLIVEVQIGRHRSEGHHPPHFRIYLIDATGRITASGLNCGAG